MTNNSWSIASTCSEPKKLIEFFIAHHISIGVARIFLFFDEPTDGHFEWFKNVPKVTAFSCGQDYWRERRPNRGRPNSHRRRQSINAEYAARKLCTTEWIAHIDVDEFLFPRSKTTISSVLSDAPKHIDAVRILPAERMFEKEYQRGTISLAGQYKLKPPREKSWGEELYGQYGKFFPNGFQGHEVGKSFKRCSNRNARFNIHFIRHNRKSIPEYKVPQSNAVLLHLFPASFEDWCHKYRRRLESPGYFDSMHQHAKNRYGLFSNANAIVGLEGIQDLFATLCVLDTESKPFLQNPQLFLDPDLDLTESINNLVKPYVNRTDFSQLSTKSNEPIPAKNRIFQIGMDLCGGRQICAMLGRNSFSYAHWDRGRLAQSLGKAKRAGTKPFMEYEHYQLIGGLSDDGHSHSVYDGFYDFDYISQWYPRCIFLLNHRPVDEWLKARTTLDAGRHLARYSASLGLQSEKQVVQRWRSDWEQHVDHVRGKAKSNEVRLIEYSLNTEKPAVFFNKLISILNQPPEEYTYQV